MNENISSQSRFSLCTSPWEKSALPQASVSPAKTLLVLKAILSILLMMGSGSPFFFSDSNVFKSFCLPLI